MRVLMMIIGIMLLIGINLAQVETVAACSGGGPTDSINNILNTELIVIGDIYALSDSGINAILSVDYYLRGEGDEQFLLLNRAQPELIELVTNGRPHPSHCSYIKPPLEHSGHFIAGLYRDANGSYHAYIVPANVEGLFQFFDPDQSYQRQSLDYDELIAYVTQQFDTSPRAPETRVLPLPAALQITTDQGTNYLLPSDRRAIVRVPENPTKIPNYGRYCTFNIWLDCTSHVIAPNGFDQAFIYPTSRGITNYWDEIGYQSTFEGEDAVFSPSSELLTVWNDQTLQVYATTFQAWRNLSNRGVSYLREITIAVDDPVLPGAGAWSPNGRTFAFSTKAGVWLWDALSETAQPVQLLRASDAPILVRSFSPFGNYLSLESNSRRFHIDMISLKEYPDGLFSPDDRLLAQFDTAALVPTPLRIYSVLPEWRVAYGWWRYSPHISQFEWTGTSDYLYATCGEAIDDGITSADFNKPWCKVRSSRLGYSNDQWVDGLLFDYDPVTHSLATLIDGNMVTVNGEIFNFDGDLDGEIISIELIPLIDLDYRNF